MKEKQETAEEEISPYKQPEWVKIILQIMRECKNPAPKLKNEPINN